MTATLAALIAIAAIDLGLAFLLWFVETTDGFDENGEWHGR
jgi:hypothetical protein